MTAKRVKGKAGHIRKGTSTKAMDMEALRTGTVVDDATIVTKTCRYDDGSDETIVFPRLAECAVLHTIRRMKLIKVVKIQVALKDGERPQKFKFSRTLMRPWKVLSLAGCRSTCTAKLQVPGCQRWVIFWWPDHQSTSPPAPQDRYV